MTDRPYHLLITGDLQTFVDVQLSPVEMELLRILMSNGTAIMSNEARRAIEGGLDAIRLDVKARNAHAG